MPRLEHHEVKVATLAKALSGLSLAAMPLVADVGRAMEAPPAAAAPPRGAMQGTQDTQDRSPAARPPDRRPGVQPPELRVTPENVSVPVPFRANPEQRPPPGRTRVLVVPRTAVAPTLDGALDDA